MHLNRVEKIDDKVVVKNVLASVADKNGIEFFVRELISINPEVHIYSTGGTYSKIREILGSGYEKNLKKVSDYTGQPEMQGGLVKTLDFKIYLGLLSETYNDAHKKDLERTSAIEFDMVVVNLYPFKETISMDDVTLEDARANIDIGGPCMLRASAKNFLRVASVCNPDDYQEIIKIMKDNDGALPLDFRFALAEKTFKHTAEYDTEISSYIAGADYKGFYNV
ncbi:MAG: hypothetical protein PQJ61_10535 [Spirochaetales bacterium]|uniref:MGS-like domain-containing protein n=1 Tax=Candidatus Thalassospirochaeta sargassi TaxID=3119039 RepID=A0AAJ1IHJ0_9SPIO|nr:hypothetical protein [Spirochaetales bacterium]